MNRSNIIIMPRHTLQLLRGTVSILALVCGWAAQAEQQASECSTRTFANLHYCSESWYGSTFWAGPDWTRVGKDWQHPGEDTPSVRAFQAPRDGRVTVTGRVYKAHADGDGVRLAILHDKRLVWQAEIEGKDQQGVTPHLTLNVRRGETIRFVVHKRGTIFCDTTHWDPVITYGDGQKFQASEGFSTTRQGDGGWCYQMETTQQAAAQGDPGWYYRPGMSFEEMIEADWRHEDGLTATPQSYSAATERQLGLARKLLADLRTGRPETFLAPEAAQIEKLSAVAGSIKPSLETCKQRYFEVRRLKRQIVLANPLLSYDKLLFCKRTPTSYSHLVMQYFGWRARPGGGLFILDNPGRSLACHDILDGRLAEGSVLEPRLSYDATRIVFSFVKCSGKSRDPGQLANDVDEDFYHVWEVNVDGTGLHQLTRGPYDDLMPTYLPDGGIAFCSTRRKGYARCFGSQFSPRWHVYTLHRMDADGANLRGLSFHDTNEWFPTVLHSGQILYDRWDYIDRDAVTHQNLWATRPDGTNPQAVWGNATPAPHCCFQPQPIPNSGKIIFTASAHHSIAGGPIAIVDPTVSDNGQQAIKRITPSIPFPEAESSDIREYYNAPWPLSEKYYLVAYSPLPLAWEPRANPANALGLYLLDAFGNRELLYRDLEIGSTNPCPLVMRPTPPVLSSALARECPGGRRDDPGRRLPGARQCAARHRQGTSHRASLPQDDPGLQHSAGGPGGRGERPGDPGHRAGRARRLGALHRSGRQRIAVPGPRRVRLCLSDDADLDLRPSGRAGRLRGLPREPAIRAPAEIPPGDAPQRIGDRSGRARRRAVLVRARRAAGPRQVLRAVPWRRSGLTRDATSAARPTGGFPGPTGRFAATVISRARAPIPPARPRPWCPASVCATRFKSPRQAACTAHAAAGS